MRVGILRILQLKWMRINEVLKLKLNMIWVNYLKWLYLNEYMNKIVYILNIYFYDKEKLNNLDIIIVLCFYIFLLYIFIDQKILIQFYI